MLGTDGQASSTGFVFGGPPKNGGQKLRLPSTASTIASPTRQGEGGEGRVKYHGNMRGRTMQQSTYQAHSSDAFGIQAWSENSKLFSLAANPTPQYPHTRRRRLTLSSFFAPPLRGSALITANKSVFASSRAPRRALATPRRNSACARDKEWVSSSLGGVALRSWETI